MVRIKSGKHIRGVYVDEDEDIVRLNEIDESRGIDKKIAYHQTATELEIEKSNIACAEDGTLLISNISFDSKKRKPKFYELVEYASDTNGELTADVETSVSEKCEIHIAEVRRLWENRDAKKVLITSVGRKTTISQARLSKINMGDASWLYFNGYDEKDIEDVQYSDERPSDGGDDDDADDDDADSNSNSKTDDGESEYPEELMNMFELHKWSGSTSGSWEKCDCGLVERRQGEGDEPCAYQWSDDCEEWWKSRNYQSKVLALRAIAGWSVCKMVIARVRTKNCPKCAGAGVKVLIGNSDDGPTRIQERCTFCRGHKKTVTVEFK